MGNAVLALLNDERAVKILVTLDEKGAPHPVVKKSLHNDGENIVYLEFLESSRTNRYMTRSLWFNETVSILVVTPDAKSYAISALSVRAIVNGKDFQHYYELAQKQYGDIDLSTVWILKPVSIIEQTLQVRVEEEAKKRPYFQHLDRLAKNREAL